MANLFPVTQPVKLFTDANGLPLSGGFIYFGQPNQNPETATIQMYWDAAGTIPAAQPIRTVNGYITRNGSTPANIYATGDCSITVRNANQEILFSNPVSVDLELLQALGVGVIAADITIADAGNYFTTDNVEAALQQIAGPGFVDFANLTTALQALLVPVGTVLDYVGTVAPTGYVMGSGLTIGSASSGAIERANADTANLFDLLWNNMANAQLPIQDSAGNLTTRGVSASADFAANKRLPVPDLRGRVTAGRDDMNGAPAGRLTNAGSGITGTTNGASGGTEIHAITTAELAVHNHGLNDSGHNHGITDPGHVHGTTDPGHTHTYNAPNSSALFTSDAGGASALNNSGSTNTGSSATNLTVNSATTGITVSTHGTGATINNTGSGTAHQNTQPTLVVAKIIKL